MQEDTPLNEDNSSLEQLRSRLYSQKAPPAFTEPRLHQPQSRPTTQSTYAAEPVAAFASAQEPTAWTPPPPPPPKKKMSWAVKFLLFALAFFIIAAGVAAYLFWGGVRTVSNDNIIITIQGPTSIASGSTVPLTLTIQNKNPAAISDSDIAVDFPDGTRSADNVTQPLLRYANNIGTIPAGGSVTRTVQAVLFGSVNQDVTLPVTFQYHTANSNELYVKTENYGFTITSSPITITTQTTGSVASGQPFDIVLQVRSNATTPLTDVAVDAQYPFGFTAQKVQMDSASQKTTGTTAQKTNSQSTTATTPVTSLFTLGTLTPGQQRTITITGTLTGSENDQRDFQFTAGTLSADGTQTISVAYASQADTVTIAKPFLAVDLSINHSTDDPTVVTAGQTVYGLLTWVNSLSTSISNAQISVKLSGNALDPTTVLPTSGYYDSPSNSIIFTPQTDSALTLLNSGDTGTGNFTLATKSATAMQSLRNPTIQLSVSVAGLPTGGSAENITGTLVKTIKVATDLELASRILYSVGAFKNSGPWPPVPNQATTYTVQLAVTNTVNSVGGATATMILPSYVTFTGNTSPSDGSITYDDTTRTVTWKVGDVPAGTLARPITAAFQISFTPSISQSQDTPILVGNQTLIGTDRFTSAQVGNTAPALTTQAATDPAYRVSFGTVGN